MTMPSLIVPSLTDHAPELVLVLGAIALFLFEHGRRDRGARASWVGAIALIAAGVLSVGWAPLGPGGTAASGFTPFAAAGFFKVVLSLALVAVLGMARSFKGFESDLFDWGTLSGLFLIASAGMFLLVSSSDFLLALVAIETISVASFVMTGIQRKDARSSEAALKYFLVGAFSTGLMIYGISLVYGATGSISFLALAQAKAGLPLVGGLALFLSGIGFKLAMVPFHSWAPDVYEGAPLPITAFLSVAPKAAVVGLLTHLFSFPIPNAVIGLLGLASAVTMTVGNLGALRQTNVKRLLAYSSIAQMGYVLMGLVAGGTAGLGAVAIYLAVYVIMNVGLFSSVMAVSDEAGAEEISAFSGLARRSFSTALCTTVFLLSLTGIPPLAGFIGKFSLFAATLQAKGLVWLAVVAALNSVVSLAYYFSIVREMFFGEPGRGGELSSRRPLRAIISLTAVLTVVLGVFPGAFLSMISSIWALR